MTLSKRVIIIMVIAILSVVTLMSTKIGWDYVTTTEFCEICHEVEFEAYNTPGDSLDYAHNTHSVTCTAYHEGAGSGGALEFKERIGIMLLLDVTGGSAPPQPEEEVRLENKKRCLKCHQDFQLKTSGLLLNPHENVKDCASCHVGHKRGLSEQVCSKCHSQPAESLKTEGGRHSKRGCAFCHPTHGYLPKCTDCHGLYHPGGFEACNSCHTNAHAPKKVEFGGSVNKTQCILCHGTVVQTTFGTQPTKHAKVECTQCHPVHGQTQSCVNCHEKHTPTMAETECSKCHQIGHVPTRVSYPSDTSKDLCAGCHPTEASQLASSKSAHADKTCAYCHRQHAQIPSCTACHGTMHGLSSGCATCHTSAHDLKFPQKT
ncbi:MAG TPA: hypothetical protein HA257_03675 [Candidatus Methanoperedenaceae archaeon]|nr:hypothetical protein [Candidatus Methanoperedenaceae archaeon]